MSSLLDKLNLRPQERRLVVFVSIAVFTALNFIFIWPHFGDLGLWQQRQKNAEAKLRQYQGEIQKKTAYQKQKLHLQDQGQYVASEAQSLQLQREVERHARLANVDVTRWSPQQRNPSAGRTTNSFFEEHSLNISISSGEKELVNFLYNLGASESLIRIRSLSLAPDTSGTRLVGNLTLVESFQKKAPSKPAAAAATATSTATNVPQPAQPAAEPAPPNPPPAAVPAPAWQPSAAAPNVVPRKIRSSPAPPAMRPTNNANPLRPPSSPNPVSK